MTDISDKDLLVSQYHSLAQILSDAGLDYPILTAAELESVPVVDLRKVVRMMKEVARTPH